MTIYELARLNKMNGGCFFCRENMRGCGDTMKGFGMRWTGKTRVVVYRKRPHPHVNNHWTFNALTGRLILGEQN